MPTINLPRDFAAPVTQALRAYGDDEATREFLRLVKAGRAWEPHFPRLLLWVARRFGVAPPRGAALLRVVLVGFRDRRLRRLVRALAELGRRQPERTGYIYEDRELLVFGDSAPRRYGVPDGFGRPMQMPSMYPGDQAPTASAPASPPPRPAAPAVRPPPSFITR